MPYIIKSDIINKKRSRICHIVIIARRNGGGDALNRIRQGFTLGELTIVLIVITIVVIVTLPITLSKMKKVDYDSYYMGYSLMKDISANVLPEVKATLPEDYAIEVNGRRYSKAFYPEQFF